MAGIRTLGCAAPGNLSMTGRHLKISQNEEIENQQSDRPILLTVCHSDSAGSLMSVAGVLAVLAIK